MATVNRLNLHEIPPELSELNMLERHLIAPAIPFMNMLSLIKGAQKGIPGQVVCVKADVNTTAKCLPRLLTDESLIRVKLKRKREYKGHHMYQDVNPTKVKQALAWLKDNNPNYEDIDVDFQDFDTLADDQLIHNNQAVSKDDCTDCVSHSCEVLANENRHAHNDCQQYDYHSGDEDFHGNLRNEYSHEDIDEDDVEVAVATEIFQIHEHTVKNIKSLFQNDDDRVVKNNNKHTIHLKNINGNGHEAIDNDVVHSENDQELDSNDEELDDNAKVENDNITNTSALVYSFLHPVDSAQYLADKHDSSILSVAPGEGNTPQKVLEMESKSFPVEFPAGSNTYNEKKTAKTLSITLFQLKIIFCRKQIC